MFGELFKELRLKQGYTLRAYCRKFGQDPAYISRLERGKIAPPTKFDILEKLALSVDLKENSDEWDNFFTSAFVSGGKIPNEIMSDEEVLRKLPVLLRTVQGQKLTDEKLNELIEIIRTE